MLKKIKNFFLCLKYPFLRIVRSKHRTLGYSTWYDAIPAGWQKAFGIQFCDDLKAALKKDKCLRIFRFTQIKETYGELCIYAKNYRQETDKVLRFYEALSICYCIVCGKPARYKIPGWANYYCEDCIEAALLDQHSSKTKVSCRLTKADIPKRVAIKEELRHIYDSINYEELWGINKC